MNIAYIRTSTIKQNEERQVEALKKYNIERYYIEKLRQRILIAHNYSRCWILQERGTLSIYMIFPD